MAGRQTKVNRAIREGFVLEVFKAQPYLSGYKLQDLFKAKFGDKISRKRALQLRKIAQAIQGIGDKKALLKAISKPLPANDEALPGQLDLPLRIKTDRLPFWDQSDGIDGDPQNPFHEIFAPADEPIPKPDLAPDRKPAESVICRPTKTPEKPAEEKPEPKGSNFLDW